MAEKEPAKKKVAKKSARKPANKAIEEPVEEKAVEPSGVVSASVNVKMGKATIVSIGANGVRRTEIVDAPNGTVQFEVTPDGPKSDD